MDSIDNVLKHDGVWESLFILTPIPDDTLKGDKIHSIAIHRVH